MARWAPEKKDVLGALAVEIVHNYGRGRAIVAIDGPDAASTAPFADDLAVAFRDVGHHCARASIDGFLPSRAERRAREADSGSGRYEDAFDYSTFRRVLVEPFRMGHGASFVTSAYDDVRDSPVQTKWRTAPADAILVVDGEFLNRPELSGLWNYSVWLDTAAADGANSDGSNPDGVNPDGANAEGASADGANADGDSRGESDTARQRYLSETNPRTKAVAIIDVADPEHPRRVFADSC